MNRRQLLSGVAVVATGGVAGCTGAVAPGTSDDPENSEGGGGAASNESDRPSRDAVVVRQLEEAPELPTALFDGSFDRDGDWNVDVPENATASAALQVGADGDIHWVFVLAEEAADATLRIRPEGGDPLHEERVRLSPSEYAAVRFERSDAYLIELPGCRTEIPVEKASVDCKSSTQAVVLTGDGEYEQTIASMMVPCPPADAGP